MRNKDEPKLGFVHKIKEINSEVLEVMNLVKTIRLQKTIDVGLQMQLLFDVFDFINPFFSRSYE